MGWQGSGEGAEIQLGQVGCVHSGVAPTATVAWSLSVFITAGLEETGSLSWRHLLQLSPAEKLLVFAHSGQSLGNTSDWLKGSFAFPAVTLMGETLPFQLMC